MRLELTGRRARITPALRRLVDGRLEKLDRMLHDRALSLQVVFDEEKYRLCVEMTLHMRGEHVFHAAGTGREWEAAITQAIGRINQQGRRQKDKWDDTRRRGPSVAKAAAAVPLPGRGGRLPPRPTPRQRARTAAAEPPHLRDVRVIRARRYDVRSMSTEEAAGAIGEAVFLVFRDERTDAVCVLFRRPDGHLGLVEPDA